MRRIIILAAFAALVGTCQAARADRTINRSSFHDSAGNYHSSTRYHELQPGEMPAGIIDNIVAPNDRPNPCGSLFRIETGADAGNCAGVAR